MRRIRYLLSATAASAALMFSVALPAIAAQSGGDAPQSGVPFEAYMDGALLTGLTDTPLGAVECHVSPGQVMACFSSREESEKVAAARAGAVALPSSQQGPGDACAGVTTRYVDVWSSVNRTGTRVRYQDVAYRQTFPFSFQDTASSVENFTQCDAIFYDYDDGSNTRLRVFAGSYVSSLVPVGWNDRADGICLSATNVNQCPYDI